MVVTQNNTIMSQKVSALSGRTFLKLVYCLEALPLRKEMVRFQRAEKKLEAFVIRFCVGVRGCAPAVLFIPVFSSRGSCSPTLGSWL